MFGEVPFEPLPFVRLRLLSTVGESTLNRPEVPFPVSVRVFPDAIDGP
jgi:hypothetical protein